jgi:DNA repair exonuclease SbcCD ATPase subunit
LKGNREGGNGEEEAGGGGDRMKVKGQVIADDGFEKNVAEKMPKVKKEEEFLSPHQEEEAQMFPEELTQKFQERDSMEKEVEKEVISEPPKIAPATDRNLDVSRIIEDLHAQILTLGRTKRALEVDLTSHQKSIHQLAQDNRELRNQVEDLTKEVEKLKEVQVESVYLQEENVDALEKIQEFQQELKVIRESLDLTIQERDEAQSRIHDLEAQLEENEVYRVKGKLKEREASFFAEENRELRSRLEEVLAQNVDLERKCMKMKKSFSEVKESLTLLRDSCKSNVYSLSDFPE